MVKRKKKIETYGDPITPLQTNFINQLALLKRKVFEAKKARDAHLEVCPHNIHYSIDLSWGEEWPEGDCWCAVCDMHFGHYCPKSPDHACHYFSEDGYVKLNTGETVPKPRDPEDDPKDYALSDSYETDDCCIFCGSPQERK